MKNKSYPPLSDSPGSDWIEEYYVLETHRTLHVSHLHLGLFPVVVAPQHHLAILPSSRHHGAVLQDTNREDPALVGPRHLLADAVTACQSKQRTARL